MTAVTTVPAAPEPWSVPGVTHTYVEVDGLRTHVAMAGDGSPLVLLHTAFQHGYAWREVIPLLAPHYRVICLDLRGCGWTDAPSHGYEKESLAADVVRLCDALDLDRVGIVGHSLGGILGFLAALRHPERVSRLMAVGVVHPWPRLRRHAPYMHRGWYQWVAASPLVGPRVIGTTPALTRWALRETGSDALPAYTSRLAEPARARAVSQMYRTLVLREMASMLRGRYRALRLTTPTLLLSGSEDWFFPPPVLEGYQAYADHMGTHIVRGAGHYLPETNPGVVAEAALRFFGGSE